MSCQLPLCAPSLAMHEEVNKNSPSEATVTSRDSVDGRRRRRMRTCWKSMLIVKCAVAMLVRKSRESIWERMQRYCGARGGFERRSRSPLKPAERYSRLVRRVRRSEGWFGSGEYSVTPPLSKLKRVLPRCAEAAVSKRQ